MHRTGPPQQSRISRKDAEAEAHCNLSMSCICVDSGTVRFWNTSEHSRLQDSLCMRCSLDRLDHQDRQDQDLLSLTHWTLGARAA